MKNRSSQLGKLGENLAARSLQKLGYQILERNWTCREGELDLVAKDQETIVFVEVKARRSTRFGSPEEALTRKKRSRVIQAARAYLYKRCPNPVSWRIDVIAIEFDRFGEVERQSHYENAITGEEAGEP